MKRCPLAYFSGVFLFFTTISVLAADEVNNLDLSPTRHKDMRLSTEVGSQDGFGTFLATQYRYALHDLLDRKGDYPHSTAIEFASIKWRVHLQNTRPWMDELTIVRILRVPTYGSNSGELSWNVDVGARTVREKFCDHCAAGHVRGGFGFAEAPLWNWPVEIFLLAEGEISIAPKAAKTAFQPALGPRAGVRIWWLDNWNSLFDIRYRYYFLSDLPSNFSASAAMRYFLGWDLALEARVARLPDGWEYAGGVFAYF